MECNNLDVFVLTYNRAKYLRIMLESLCSQTATGFKIKILNNCSTDNTLDVIEDIKKQHPDRDIDVITHEKNLGNAGNFIRSQELATNEYTAIFHDDDAIHPEYIDTAMTLFKIHPQAVMCTGHKSIIWNVDNNNWNALYKNYHYYSKNNGVFLQLLIHRTVFADAIYNTAAYKKIAYNPKRYGKLHDNMFMFELNNLGDIIFIQGICMRWRQHNNSDSNTLSTGPFPNEIWNIIQDLSKIYTKHRFLYKPLLWNFSYFLYNWSVLSKYLTWYEFLDELVRRNVFGKFESLIYRNIFCINILNKIIAIMAKHYKKKVARGYPQARF